MKKIAIIYTGEIRTCNSTIQLFKKNVILNENYHVFSVIQITDNVDYYTNLIEKTLKDNLKSFVIFDKNDNHWIQLRDELVNNIDIDIDIDIDSNWKSYLTNSGSIIEYYQMYLSFKNIQEYENKHNFKYDFVLRFRTDTVLKDMIQFDYSILNYEYIKNLFYKINKNTDIISINSLTHFMNIVFNENRTHYKMKINSFVNSKQLDYLLRIQDEETFFKEVENYIKNGNYIISLRKNIIYFMKRELMDKIHILGITYGKYKQENNNYWFNAESQFEEICCQNNIDIFNSTTKLEDNSLYNYNYENYFDKNNELLDNEYSFFIKRN
jgi:hypothetical protein